MIGPGRQAYAGLSERLDGRRRARGLAKLPGELFAVADLIGRDSQLRSALSDAGKSAEARGALAREVFAGRLLKLTTEVLVDVVSQRWPGPAELLDAVEGLAAQSAFLVAENRKSLDRVEGELFEVQQLLARSADLQMAFTDPAVGSPAKAALVESLLDRRAAGETVQVLSHTLSHLRGRRADAAIKALIAQAAEQRDRSVAEVRVARPLEPDQASRLAAALSRLHGRDVRLNVAVDPAVIGGVSVRIGSEVRDGTVATRIAQARRALAD